MKFVNIGWIITAHRLCEIEFGMPANLVRICLDLAFYVPL